MQDYPSANVAIDHVEPVPRRIRATLAGKTVLDTTTARYRWERPNYPQYYVPLEDVNAELLVDEHDRREASDGSVELFGLQVGQETRRNVARLFRTSPIEGIAGTVRFDWSALDSWYEEDEEVFGHPRSPYVRVDALRSTRHVRVEVDGLVLADSRSPVLVFETGLPTRYYLTPTEVNFVHLVPSATASFCPYKGPTSGYWSVRGAEGRHPDVAWSYGFPMRELLPISGLVAFYNERVDIVLDGKRLERPRGR